MVASAAALGAVGWSASTAPVASAASDGLPTIRHHPSWLPADLGDNATLILVPGTSDFRDVAGPDIVGGSAPAGAGQYARTVGLGFFDPYRPKVKVVDYPQAFGAKVFGRLLTTRGTGTYNESVETGTANGLADAERAWVAQGRRGTIILNGYSQSVPIAINIAYLLHQKYRNGEPGAIPDENVVVIGGADTRFPETGVETVLPSVIPGAYTNGPRDEAETGNVRVISYCIRGDVVCGMGNPLANPLAWAFYAGPGATIHGKLGDQVNKYPVERTWTTGNTTYVVLDGGNPWGMWLRKEGVPLPANFDSTVDRLVPVPEPGEPAIGGNGARVPTPREVQQSLANSIGWQLPVTDPDARAKNHNTRPDTVRRPTLGSAIPQFLELEKLLSLFAGTHK